ncbi:MAG: hemolysin family protein [Kofleriaceae bacterium]
MTAWLELRWALPGAVVTLALMALVSASETAVFSVRRGERDQLLRSGHGADRRVLALLGQSRATMATSLIANHGLAAVFAVLVADACAYLPGAERPLTQFGYAAAITLPLIVMLGEVLPKTLALKAPLAWARATAWVLIALGLVLAPVRLVFGGLAAALARPLGGILRPAPRSDLSEEEFRHLVDAGSAEGQVDARERRLIHRVFEFSDKDVGQVMTPREKVFALSYDLPMARLGKEVALRGFSRVPIFQKSLDNVRGILNAKDLVRPGAAPRTLAELLHEPLFVPRTTPVKRLFLTFKQKKVHMAIVVNEYGKVLGVVTMDDVLEQIFGAIRDEREAMQGTRRRGRGGRTPVPGPGVETGPVVRVDPELLLADADVAPAVAAAPRVADADDEEGR